MFWEYAYIVHCCYFEATIDFDFETLKEIDKLTVQIRERYKNGSVIQGTARNVWEEIRKTCLETFVQQPLISFS